MYEDASLVFPNKPTLNTGGCPYRGLTYRPGYMRSLNPSVECALAPNRTGCTGCMILALGHRPHLVESMGIDGRVAEMPFMA